MTTTGRDRPAVELLKSVGWTVQLAVFALLALSPLVAGFVAPLGPPVHAASVADVSPADAAPDGAVDVSELDENSRTLFESILAEDGDRIRERTDDPPGLLQGETVVVDGDYAFRVEATEKGHPRRPLAILAGLLGSVVGTVLAGAMVSKSPL
jgi:hypothetical protein